MRLLYIFLFILKFACSLRHFRLGRSNYGNIGAPAGADETTVPAPSWFDQKLDHNNPSGLKTWKQRYFANTSFYVEKGPVFLMIGGEGPADPRWMTTGALVEYAQKFKALCFLLEHRYYGESHPTEDISVKNLKYLSSLQALEDLAYFISKIKKQFNLGNDVKWIVFGGSYSGSLAAWARAKYPHLIHAAISSSAPLLAQVNFKEYFQIVVQSLSSKTGSNECSNVITQAHQQIEHFMKINPKIIEKEFKVCKPFSMASKNDIKNFYNSIADDFADLVQYNEDNRISADTRYKNVTINTVCDILTSSKPIPAYRRLAWFNAISLKKQNQTCMDYSYNNMIKELANTKWSDEGARQWMWQTCTEFGFFQTCSAEVETFGDQFPLDFYIKQCEDVFGKKYNESFINAAVDWTNIKYGARQIPANRIVYVHGSVDPWHYLGITVPDNNQDVDTPIIYIPGTAHCADVYPSRPEDPEELVEARVEIQQHLVSWVGLP